MLRRINVGAARDVLFQYVILHRPEQLSGIRAVSLCDGDVQREQDDRGGVDRHRGRDLLEIDASKEPLHVFNRINRHTDLADLPHCHGIIGVVTDLRREVEGYRKTGGAVRQQIFVAAIRFLGVTHTGVLAHGPQSSAVHRGLNAASERILSWISNLLVIGPA